MSCSNDSIIIQDKMGWYYCVKNQFLIDNPNWEQKKSFFSFLNDEQYLHNLDGPAIKTKDNKVYYYIDGKKYKLTDWHNKSNKIKHSTAFKKKFNEFINK